MKARPVSITRSGLLLVCFLALLGSGCAGTQPRTETPEAATARSQPRGGTTSEATQADATSRPQPLLLKPDYPESYIVRKGDTLWGISARFLRDPWRWPELWHKNPKINNPHLIYPGDILTLIYIDGKPTLQVQRGRPTVTLSPRVRVEELVRPIPTIPIEAIRQFLHRPRIVGKNELKRAPYIVSAASGHLIAGAGIDVYARGVEDNDVTEFVVVRQGQVYREPSDGEVLGYEAIHVADAELRRFGDPAMLSVVRSSREVLRGDRMLPAQVERFEESFIPRAPANRVDGRIIAVMDGVTQIGQYQVVVLNLGHRDEIERGHVLAVYQRGDRVLDEVRNQRLQLPDERAGTLMVFRAFEQISYALVMEATDPMHVLDRVMNP